MLRLPFRHHPSRLEVFLSLALKEGIKNIYSTTFINICCKAHEIHLSLFTPYYEYKNITNEYVRSWYFCKMSLENFFRWVTNHPFLLQNFIPNQIDIHRLLFYVILSNRLLCACYHLKSCEKE